VVRKVVRAVHTNYNSDNRYDDIALLQLESPVDFTDLIQPVCILPMSDDNGKEEEQAEEEPDEGLECISAGWGKVGIDGDF